MKKILVGLGKMRRNSRNGCYILLFCFSFGYVTPSIGTVSSTILSASIINPEEVPLIYEITKALEHTVSGTVTDSQGMPIPGVTVSVQGTSTGTATNIDGKYALTVHEGATLVFSFIGYETRRVEVGERSVIDVVLNEDMSSLDEVVVEGYIAQRKADFTEAVSVVSEEGIRMNNFSNVLQSLQGKVPGM